jgi:hypothetical protein
MTVYVLGAGASRHAGYPLASQMAAELFAWMLTSANADYCSAAKGLAERFGPSPNIEDVITELRTRIRTLESGSEEDRLERTLLAHWRGSLVHAVREWFREIHERPAPGYAAFANGIVRPGDVVVTFNYDDSMERDLCHAGKWDIHRGYGFPVGDGERSPTLLLKLHGSINWMASISGGKTSGTAMVGSGLSLGSGPLIPQADLEYLGYEAIPGHRFPGGGALPALIMPGRKKEFFFATSLGLEWTGFWDGLWAKARNALKSAEELVVCGFSLLPADERACDLIVRVPSGSIPVTVVSGDQSDRIAAEFQRNGFSNVRSEQNQFFENWVKAAEWESRP